MAETNVLKQKWKGLREKGATNFHIKIQQPPSTICTDLFSAKRHSLPLWRHGSCFQIATKACIYYFNMAGTQHWLSIGVYYFTHSVNKYWTFNPRQSTMGTVKTHITPSFLPKCLWPAKKNGKPVAGERQIWMTLETHFLASLASLAETWLSSIRKQDDSNTAPQRLSLSNMAGAFTVT